MPPALPNTAYLNFLSSHDGIGLRPIEGILTDQQLEQMVSQLEHNGSLFSWRNISQSEKKIYEANITLFDSLKGHRLIQLVNSKYNGIWLRIV